jgi:hypothetical protein
LEVGPELSLFLKEGLVFVHRESGGKISRV